MQRRPLVIDPNEHHFTSPSERFWWTASYGMAGMYGIHGGFNALQYMQTLPSYHVETNSPVYTAQTPDDFFAAMGFPSSPVTPDHGHDEYPKVTPPNAHPKCYLKWGAQLYRSNHLIFEMGELYYLVSVDIKKTNTVPHKPWQIDSLVIRNGKKKFHVPCDDFAIKSFSDRLLASIAETVVALNNDADIHKTTKDFQKALSSILKDMESVAIDYNPNGNETSVHPSKSDPFTP